MHVKLLGKQAISHLPVCTKGCNGHLLTHTCLHSSPPIEQNNRTVAVNTCSISHS